MINKVAISDIKIPTRKRGLSEDKVKELAESIKELGLLQPIIISEDKVLISGLHRIEACKLLGWSEIPCIVKSYNQLDKELAEIDENLVRAELSVLERAEALKRRKEIYEVKYPETKKYSSERMKKIRQKEKISICQKSFSEDTAQKLGVSSRTIRHEVQIAEKIDSQVKEKIKDTELADNKEELLLLARLEPEKQRQVVDKIAKGEAQRVKDAIRKIKVEELEKKGNNPLPNKKYNIIYADPPWQYWEGGEKNQSLHYPTMTTEEIKNLPVKDLADTNCILFLWATSPILPEAIEVLKEWGFSYSTIGFVWVKSKKDGTGFAFGNGVWTRANVEFCLIGIKGHIERKNANISQIVYAPREEHSKKPDIVRDLIVKLVGDLPRIELFARKKVNGWDSWGNEL